MCKFKRYTVRKIGECKGHPRIYLDMIDLVLAGFKPGSSYQREINVETKCITLSLADDGQYLVSRKEKGGQEYPIIDINSSHALKPFEGMQAIRVVIYNNKIHILPLASEAKRLKRLQRLSDHLAKGRLETAATSFGGGVLDHASHKGFKDAGLNASLLLANEIDEHLLEHAAVANDVITDKTFLISAPMQEFVQDTWAMQHVPEADIFALGISCSGASIAGKSKLSLPMMENHERVGHLMASAIMLINQINPSVIVLENVKQYQETASAAILRNHLRDSGYETQELFLSAKDFGCLENRERWFMVASTKGINLDLGQLEPKVYAAPLLANVLEDVALDADCWRNFDYLKTKQQRDADKGNGFNMQTVTPQSNSVPVLRAGYKKAGSTDALLTHPNNPDLLRQFSGIEHARIKGVPEHLIKGLSETDAHIMLGQGVCYEPVAALFKRIGEQLKAWAATNSIVTQCMSFNMRLTATS